MIFIRSAMVSDLAAVKALLRESWHHTYDATHGAEKIRQVTDEWHSLAALAANLKKPWSEFLVADSGEALRGVGFASQSSEDYTMIHHLYVAPDALGQGIGAQLLQEIFEAFPEAKSFRLEVDEANDKAVGFYKHFGFTEISRTANCGADGSNMPAIVMEKRSEF